MQSHFKCFVTKSICGDTNELNICLMNVTDCHGDDFANGPQ